MALLKDAGNVIDRSCHKYKGPLQEKKEKGSFDDFKIKKTPVPQSNYEERRRYQSDEVHSIGKDT